MRELHLSLVLGSAITYLELLELVEVVDGIDWMDAPVAQDRRGYGLKMRNPVLLPLAATLCGIIRTSSAWSMVTLIGVAPSFGV